MTNQQAQTIERLHDEAMQMRELLIHAQNRYNRAQAEFQNAIAAAMTKTNPKE